MNLETIAGGDGCRIEILPVIKGLESEVTKVKNAFDYVRPDVVAISISKEELEGLKNIPEDFEPELTRYEEIYVEGLSRFGEVAAPPPCYVAALEMANHTGVPIVPVDLDEQAYTELYIAAVPGTTLFRHSTRTWLLKRRRFSDESAEDFVLAWDRAVNGLEGFQKIEHQRAREMANGVVALCDGRKKVLAIIELERAGEVSELIRARLNKGLID